MMTTARPSIHTTLIIRLSSLGDVVLTSLLCRVLRKRFPDAQVDFLVKTEYADLVRFNPNVSRIIEFTPTTSLGVLRRHVKASRYDLIIDAHDSLRSRFLCFGLPHVVRVRKRKLARFLLVTFGFNLYRRQTTVPSVALRYVEPVEFLGVKDDGEGLELEYPQETRQHVAEMMGRMGVRPGTRGIGLCPSSRHANKMWPGERYARTASQLLNDGKARSVFLFGSKEERSHCEEIAKAIRSECPDALVVNLAGQLSMLETACAMEYCDVVLSNDSGLMHIAAARKRKVVAIFGPTVRELGFFPFRAESRVIEDREVPCRPCTHIGRPTCPNKHFWCMLNISPETVAEAADSLLHNVSGSGRE